MSKPADQISAEDVTGTVALETPIVPLPDPDDNGVKTTPEIDAPEIVSENADHNLIDHIESASNTYLNFDPTIHASNSDGSPKYKADGTYALKRGRKAGAQNVVRDSLPQVENKPTYSSAPQTEAKIDYVGLGKVYAGMFFGATSSVIGPEWMPQSKEEQKHIETAFSTWAKSTGASDLPPGWALVFSLGAYSAARLQVPNTASKFQRLKEKVFVTFVWIKNKVRK